MSAVDELERRYREAEAIAGKWAARDEYAFHVMVVSSLVCTITERRPLVVVTVLAWIVWLVMFVKHLRANRARDEARARWRHAFYEEKR